MRLTARPPLVRNSHDRVVLGVAGGLGAHLGIDPRWIRLGFAITSGFGAGIAVYFVAAAVMPGDDGTPSAAGRWRPRDGFDIAAAVAVLLGGALLLQRAVGVLPLGLAVPVAFAVTGLVVLVAYPGPGSELEAPFDLPTWVPPAAREALGALGTRRGIFVRAIVGVALVLAGLVVLVASTRSWTQLRDALLALSVMFLGATVIVGPWFGRLAAELLAERRERIRSQEREEVGAHLHDSVLQTLALIQRRADDPREVGRLARRQERELRSWLLTGRDEGRSGDVATFAALVDRYAAELEDEHTVPVEVVHVRDCPLDDRLEAVALAAREAIGNAQRHSGADKVSVYTEVGDHDVRVFVRDRGCGFDVAAIPADRHGISRSIEGRLRRLGGQATVTTTPGSGTQVELVLPKEGRL